MISKINIFIILLLCGSACTSQEVEDKYSYFFEKTTGNYRVFQSISEDGKTNIVSVYNLLEKTTDTVSYMVYDENRVAFKRVTDAIVDSSSKSVLLIVEDRGQVKIRVSQFVPEKGIYYFVIQEDIADYTIYQTRQLLFKASIVNAQRIDASYEYRSYNTGKTIEKYLVHYFIDYELKKLRSVKE